MRALGIRLSLRFELLLVLGLLLAGSLGVVVLDEISQARTSELQSKLKDESLGGLRRTMAVTDAYAIEVVDAVSKVAHGNMTWAQGEQVVEAAAARIDLHWQALARQPRNAEQEQVFEQASRARLQADLVVAEILQAMAQRDYAALQALAVGGMGAAIDPVTARLRHLSDLIMIEAERAVRADSERLQQVRRLRLALIALVLTLTGLMGREMLRNIVLGVASLVRMAKGMRRRNYEIAPSYRPSGELGELTDAFIEMRAGLRSSEAELHSALEQSEQVKRALQERELFQRSLLSAAQTAILSVDATGTYIHVNPFAESLLGYRSDELVGQRTPDDLHVHDELRRAAGELTAATDRPIAADWKVFLTIAGQRAGALEWTLQRKDGSLVPVLQAVSAMRDDEGTLLGLLFVATDLTDVKRLEHELRESEARAREASRAKSAFVAAMSHEIRTPMIGVTGMVEVLSHTQLDEEQRRSLNIIQHSAQSLLQIIGDILDFSKIEAGRMELVPEVVSLRRLVASATHNFLGTASSKGLHLGFEVDPRVAEASFCDPVRLRQILSNFLSNAVKFTEHGRIDVRVDVLNADGSAQQIEFSVRDTGIGVSAQAQARLFQPFAQAESDTTRKYGGSGLGLTICRRLAALMGGDVRMQSAPGLGTTMRLRARIPIADPALLPDEDEATLSGALGFLPRALPTAAQAEAERSLLLLVDDHPTNRLVIVRQLALGGFVCETAEDGEQGLAQWESGRFALVLSDVHMPGMDGYQMTQAIRAREDALGRARTPIIALTAAAMKGEAERCLNAGMDDYLTKPVSISVLVDRLHKWMPHLQPAQSVSSAPVGSAPAGSAPVPSALVTQLLPQLRRPQPLDERVLAEVAGADAATQRAILDDFIESSARDVAQVQRALRQVDMPALAREAHKIKGAARLVGAVELETAAEALETAGKADDLRAVQALAPDLVTAFERLRLYCAERDRG